MDGWWCVRCGEALAWLQAPSAASAVRRSLVLFPLGDWADDARKLRVFPPDAYPEHAGPRDYTRAVLNANVATGRRPPRWGSSRRSTPPTRSSPRTAHSVRSADAAYVADAACTSGAPWPRKYPQIRSWREPHVLPSSL